MNAYEFRYIKRKPCKFALNWIFQFQWMCCGEESITIHYYTRWASLFTGSKFPTLGLTTVRSTSRAMWSTWCTLFRLKVTIWFITIILILCHLVMFAVPPRIHNLHPLNGSITVRSGSRVRLECRASGQPPPSIYWSRKVINITIWSPSSSSSTSSSSSSSSSS